MRLGHSLPMSTGVRAAKAALSVQARSGYYYSVILLADAGP